MHEILTVGVKHEVNFKCLMRESHA